MITNIEFKSNVYPVKHSITEDAMFLSKVYDYVTLKRIDLRLTEYDKRQKWTDFQRRIIKENPICSLCKPDPCWGMNSSNPPVWVCKCVKTDCESFNKCRPDFDEKELLLFSYDYRGDLNYQYEYGESALQVHPVLHLGDTYCYDSNMNQSTKAQETHIQSKDKGVNILKLISDLEKSELHEVSKDDQMEEKISVDTVMSAITTLESKNKNIFDFFIETEQEDIIQMDSNTLLFIDAGPGTGKTYTLIKKMEYMVTQLHVDANGILVLCFTNSAVNEIKERLGNFIKEGGDRALLNIDVRTFHSFSWWLISQCNDLFKEEGWTPVSLASLSYEKSLLLAKKAIMKYSKDIMSEWTHFIVDEVQDLTNELGRLVLETVKMCVYNSCGVTVFGDSCQAIYDYTQEHTDAPFTSNKFYNSLFAALKDNAQFYKLTKNHRQNDMLIETTVPLRNSILEKNHEKIIKSIECVLLKTPTLEASLDKLSNSDILDISQDKKLGILFRNNGQVLLMSSNMRKRGIEHTVSTSEVVRNFSPYIADVFKNYNKALISYETFEELYQTLTQEAEITAFEIWERFKHALYREDEVLAVNDILGAISLSKIDDPVFRTLHKSKTTVSTIHKAKGREYDSVIIEKPFVSALLDPKSEIEEFKTLYVALTRAKSKINLASFKSKISVYPIEIFYSKRKRWGTIKKQKLIYLEFLNNLDIDINRYAFIDKEIMSKIRVNDSLSLKRKIDNNVLSYVLIHDDTENEILTINSTYSDDIKNRMSIKSNIEMPSVISGLYVSGIYSQIVDSEFLNNNPNIQKTTPNGVWKWIDVIGLGHMSYDTY